MKIIIGIILSLFVTFANASTYVDLDMSENIKIAERFCAKNKECINMIALELDDAYRKGQKLKFSTKPWHLKVNQYTKELTTLCDTAPNKELCHAYRTHLLNRYIDGLK